MEFPVGRMRRLRRSESLRALVRETHLEPGALIYPLFVCPGEGVRREVASMPGVFNLSIDEALKEAEAAAGLGIGGLLLFGLPLEKDEQGSGAWAEDGIVQGALRALKSVRGLDSLVLIADVCLCEYTTHGHCGVVRRTDEVGRLHEDEIAGEAGGLVAGRVGVRAVGSANDVHSRGGGSGISAEVAQSGKGESAPGGFEVVNDASVALLAKTAVSLARAGADVVAPSDMMDGRVGAIRRELDGAGLEGTPILSYAAKFASAFYGPFREAAGSAPQFGDRRSYQMDGANLREAMREIELDVAEGADMVLMKPAMPYLDVICAARERFDLPIGAYQVSGEYAMLEAAFARGWLDRERAMMESLLSIRRAGAGFIVTYFAKDAAKVLR